MKVPRPFAKWLLTLLLASLALEIAGQKLRDSPGSEMKNDGEEHDVETFGGDEEVSDGKSQVSED